MRSTVALAARALVSGRLVVYPTDTLWGLGARASDPAAVERLLAAKGRPPGRATSVAVSSPAEVEALAELTPAGRRFVRTHLPGPYTLLVRPSRRARRSIARALLAPDGSLGLRVPDHATARELARRAGPLTATSANRHGRPPCDGVASARRAFAREVAVYLAGPPKPSGEPSVLVDLTGPRPRGRARAPR